MITPDAQPYESIVSMISIEVLEFLLKLLDNQQLHVGDPNFESVAAIVGRAKRELVQAIAEEASYPEVPDAPPKKRSPRLKTETVPLSGNKHGVDPAT